MKKSFLAFKKTVLTAKPISASLFYMFCVCVGFSTAADESKLTITAGLSNAIEDAKSRGLALELPYCLKYEMQMCDRSVTIGNKVSIDDSELRTDSQFAFKVKGLDGVLSGNVFQATNSGGLLLDTIELSDDAVFVISSPMGSYRLGN